MVSSQVEFIAHLLDKDHDVQIVPSALNCLIAQKTMTEGIDRNDFILLLQEDRDELACLAGDILRYSHQVIYVPRKVEVVKRDFADRVFHFCLGAMTCAAMIFLLESLFQH